MITRAPKKKRVNIVVGKGGKKALFYGLFNNIFFSLIVKEAILLLMWSAKIDRIDVIAERNFTAFHHKYFKHRILVPKHIQLLNVVESLMTLYICMLMFLK